MHQLFEFIKIRYLPCWEKFLHFNTSICLMSSPKQTDFCRKKNPCSFIEWNYFNLFTIHVKEVSCRLNNITALERRKMKVLIQSAFEILCVADGQTRANLLSFTQFHHDTGNLQRLPRVSESFIHRWSGGQTQLHRHTSTGCSMVTCMEMKGPTFKKNLPVEIFALQLIYLKGSGILTRSVRLTIRSCQLQMPLHSCKI